MLHRCAIIIGGGPAGAVAGICLARRGWKIDLFEQHRFPRDKVCGECLSALGIAVLQRLGLRSRIEAAEPLLLRRAMLHAAEGLSVELPLGSAMWGISRWTLDDLLLQCASDAGAKIHQPARCEKIEASAMPSVCARDLQINRLSSYQADWILLADGKGALMGSRRRPTGDFGLKAHFTDVNGPRDAIELFGVDGHYGGVAPIEKDRWNAAFTVSAALLDDRRGDAEAVFNIMCAENRRLGQRFSRARLASDWMISPLPRFAVSCLWPQRIIPLGNAAAALEPIGGEGMGLAMRSAELAAQFLDEHPSSSTDMSSLRNDFNGLWRVRGAACRMAALALSNLALADPLAELLARDDRLGRTVMHLIGKT